MQIKSQRDSDGDLVSISVDKLIPIKDGPMLKFADDAQTLAFRDFCLQTATQTIEHIQPVHEVKEFLREVCIAL